MNYYNPNYYNMYNNPISPPMGMNQNNLSQQNQIMGQNGKVVDGEDVVRATEVPIGGYGIFPKADLSEIYLKTWNNNGTTSIVTYKAEKNAGMPPQNAITLDVIAQKIDALENKIASLKADELEPPRKENREDAFKL